MQKRGLHALFACKPLNIWSRLPELNRQSSDYESDALPIEPRRQIPEFKNFFVECTVDFYFPPVDKLVYYESESRASGLFHYLHVATDRQLVT